MCEQDPTADLAAGRIARRLRAAGIAADVVEIPTGERHRAPQHGPYAWHVLTAAAVATVDPADVEAAAGHLQAAGFAVAADGAALTVTLRPGVEVAADLDAAPAPEVEDEPEAAPVVVVIACGGKKLDHAAPAGALYVGSYHRQARAAADAVADRIPAGARVMILSARYGLLDLADVVDTYDETLPYRRSLAGPSRVEELAARQLAATGARTVVALCGARYAEVLRYAARQAGADLVEPLAGTTSQGDQLRRYANIRTGGDWSAAIVDAVAGPAPVEAAPVAEIPAELVTDSGQFLLFAA